MSRVVVDRSKCCGCEACVAICPTGAIKLVNGKAEIIAVECVCCGACAYECFYDAIILVRGSRENKN